MFAFWAARNRCYVLLTFKNTGSIIAESKRFNLNQRCSGPVPVDFSIFNSRSWFRIADYTPAPPKMGRGVTGFTLTPVCQSVSATFFKKNSFISSWHLPLWVNLWTPIHFRVPTINFGPRVADMWPKWVSGTFWKNYLLNSFHTWHLPNDSLHPYSFFVPVVILDPLLLKIWPKIRFPELFRKIDCSIPFILGIL